MKIKCLAAVMALTGCTAEQAGAPDTAMPGEARVSPGGEWALGRWDGSVVRIGTANGTAGLTKEARTLIVEKVQDGRTTCYWFIADTARSPTKRCSVGANGISLVSSGGPVVELSRSGADSLQGTWRPAYAVAASGAGMGGSQVFMTRSK